jgi:hypothetical protein
MFDGCFHPIRFGMVFENLPVLRYRGKWPSRAEQLFSFCSIMLVDV